MARRAYTLVELLLVVVVLGIAGAMVIPAMGQTQVLRIQAAVRTLVADMTFMQADAMAFQSRRVMVFGRVARWDSATLRWEIVEGNGYTLYAPLPGAAALNLQTDAMDDPSDPGRPYSRDFDDKQFSGAVVSAPSFNNGPSLIFDELGGPVTALDSDDPGTTGTVVVEGTGSRFRVSVEAYTGRVTVQKVQ